MRVKTVYVKDKQRLNLSSFPNFSVTGSIAGMKKKYYGEDAILVRCGSWIYNVTSRPDIWLESHNKNYTKEQYHKIVILKEILDCIDYGV